jgi:hypothetical protein
VTVKDKELGNETRSTPSEAPPVEPRAADAGPAAFDRPGVIFRWDLDKTYLRTEFESFRKMVRIPFEAATDKVHLPGVPELIRALRRSAGESGLQPYVFFLSASPPQIGNAIREKLRLDGIDYEGIIFKDQLRNLIRGKWRSLREQVGYKLGELLASRIGGPAAGREVLFGDDWESDPLIYSLYADILAGAISPELVGELLLLLDVERAQIAQITEAAAELGRSPADVVARIYINLERRTPPASFHVFGARLVPAFNYFQTGASLYELGLLDEAALPEIASALVEQAGYTADRLRNSLDDLARRGHLMAPTRLRIARVLAGAGLVPRGRREVTLRARFAAFIERQRRRWRRRRPAELAPAIDYRAIMLGWGARR